MFSPKQQGSRKTVPLVEPQYCDTIVRRHSNFSHEDLPHLLGEISGRSVTVAFSETYLYFLRDIACLYVSNGNRIIRNSRGDSIANSDSACDRKYAWLREISSDEVFESFFRFTIEPKSKVEISAEFNSASGKYLLKWGRWLGKTLFVPSADGYQSIDEDSIPTVEEFWSMILLAYNKILHRSWSETVRSSMEVGELRVEVCCSRSILPLSFDCLLAEIFRNKLYYTQLELVGLPPHRLKERVAKSKFDPITVDNSKYYYIMIHALNAPR